MSAETYDGLRDYDSLLAFAEENVAKPVCSIFQVQNCNAEQQNMIRELELKSIHELEDIVVEVETKVKDREVIFDEKISAIQKEYDALVEAFNKELAAIKEEHNYKYVEQVLGAKHERESATDEGEL
jgi:hypothetical protein